MAHNLVLILDFGSQVTQLIARRIREIGIYCEVKNYNISIDEIKKSAPQAIIFSGGPASVFEPNSPTITIDIFSLNIPILGICYGEQLICHLLGGEVTKSSQREFGKAEINFVRENLLFHNIENPQVWMSHGDHIAKIPADFKVIATTPKAPFAGIANDKKRIYGVQFHPEVYHSIEGNKILANFLIKIANCQPSWTMKNYKDEEIARIKKIVNDKHVICGLSGGVDSSVAAVLINQAVSKQLTCIFVDHGLLRKGEGAYVKKIFSKNFAINFIYCDAKEIFLNNLKNISDPEQKRKIIGKTFIEVFDREASKIKNVEFLAQGTLYPDVIESLHPNDGASQTIKSHHNVGGLPKDMKLKLLEPLRMLFKDEVRKLGNELNIPNEIVSRHPFPGPVWQLELSALLIKKKLLSSKKLMQFLSKKLEKPIYMTKFGKLFVCFYQSKLLV